MANLGFIGLGIMGKPMAKHLLAKGYHVIVCDINPEPVKECCAVGGDRYARVVKKWHRNQILFLSWYRIPQMSPQSFSGKMAS